MNLKLAARYIDPKSILDVGAYLGSWAYDASQAWPDAKFHLVEGNPKCSEALEESGQPFDIALLSDKKKTVPFYTNREKLCSGSSIYREVTPHYADAAVEDIETTTLDLLFSESQFDLVKIDVQGSELDVMRGGVHVLAKAKALLLEVSLEEYNSGAPLIWEVLEYAAEMGFRKCVFLGNACHYKGRVIQKDVLILR